MACYFKVRQISKPIPALFVLAGLFLLVPQGIPAAQSQAGGASVGLCEFTAQGKYYVSAIFGAANDNDKSQWEIAWSAYIHNQVDPFPGNSYCRFFPSRAGAQQTLQVQRAQMGAAKVIDTGWTYTGPVQVPPSSAPRAAGIGPR